MLHMAPGTPAVGAWYVWEDSLPAVQALVFSGDATHTARQQAEYFIRHAEFQSYYARRAGTIRDTTATTAALEV